METSAVDRVVSEIPNGARMMVLRGADLLDIALVGFAGGDDILLDAAPGVSVSGCCRQARPNWFFPIIFRR